MRLAALPLPPPFRLVRYETVGSTNDEAKRLAQGGAESGTIVCAGTQTAGRGRRGREWVSPPGNLYLSIVWRPECPLGHAAQLGFVASLALAEAVDPAIPAWLALRLKWPNDLLLGGRKLAGILLESETASGSIADFVVIGIGVNLASAPDGAETPATSLAGEGLPPVAPETVLASLAERFGEWAGRWRRDGFAPVRAGWLARASGVGEAVRVRLERTTLHGRFADLDESGALLLDQESGRRRIAAGDVFPAAAG